MKTPLFSGVCTALVTPFENGAVNYHMLECLIRRQIRSGIKALVICGTTGESATLTDMEKITLFQKAKDIAGNDCLIIAGTGSNCTEHAVHLSIAAEAAKADALLVVSPYYNKATAEGLTAHYRAIASSVHIPVILYNVPSRTGLDIPVSVYQELATTPNIAGIKEASADITKIARILSVCPRHFSVWSGNDDQTVPAMSLGAVGVISVLSNLFPEACQAMACAALDGDFDTAADLQLRFLPLIEGLFCEVNPIPVKAAMKLLGYDCGECRLPLTPIRKDHLELLKKRLSAL